MQLGLRCGKRVLCRESRGGEIPPTSPPRLLRGWCSRPQAGKPGPSVFWTYEVAQPAPRPMSRAPRLSVGPIRSFRTRGFPWHLRPHARRQEPPHGSGPLPGDAGRGRRDGHALDLEPCVGLWRPEDYARYTERALAELPPLSPRLSELERFFYGSSQDAELDAAGRIMLPGFLTEHAGLSQEVVVVGAGDRLELWDRTAGGSIDRAVERSRRDDGEGRPCWLRCLTDDHRGTGGCSETWPPSTYPCSRMSSSAAGTAARPGRDRLHVRRRRPRQAWWGSGSARRGPSRDRSRPGGGGALRGARRGALLHGALHPRRLRGGAASCSPRRACGPTWSTSTSACPRCRSTCASAASPTPSTRPWTCAWIPRRRSTRARFSGNGISAGWRRPARLRRGAPRGRDRPRDRPPARAGSDRDDAASSSRSSTQRSPRPRVSPAAIRPSGSSRRCGSPSTTSSASSTARCRSPGICCARAGCSRASPSTRWRTGG